MTKLYWLQADNTIIEFALKAEQNLIGRSNRCDVRIKHPGISSEHAVIRLHAGLATIQDMGSTNGTRVNGRKVDSQTLRHGDQITIGREKLMYFAEVENTLTPVLSSLSLPAAELAPSGETVNTDIEAHDEDAISQPVATDSANMPPHYAPQGARVLQPQPPMRQLMAHLIIISGPGAGKRFALDQPATTIGKEGRHVIEFLRASPTRWQLVQKEGVNPAYVNGDALTSVRTLASGDFIEMSGVRMKFEISLQTE